MVAGVLFGVDSALINLPIVEKPVAAPVAVPAGVDGFSPGELAVAIIGARRLIQLAC